MFVKSNCVVVYTDIADDDYCFDFVCLFVCCRVFLLLFFLLGFFFFFFFFFCTVFSN